MQLGIFDSGIGGFTVLQRVNERFGDISCLYIGDLERSPYGSKSKRDIRSFAEETVSWLNSQEVNFIIVACNTTNSVALDVVNHFSKVPVFGLIEAASYMVQSERIGVLATETTALSRAYTKSILLNNPNAFVIEKSCPKLVPMIEMMELNNREISNELKSYLKPLIEANVDEIILGCSHYPLIMNHLKELVPKTVKIIDPALGLVNKLDRLVSDNISPLGKIQTFSNTRFCVTADARGFASKAMYWLKNYPEVELITLRSKACVS